MGIRLSVFGWGRLIALGVVMIAAAVRSAVNYVDHSLHFRSVTATVTSADFMCAAHAESSSSTGKTDWFRCGDLMNAPASRLAQLRIQRGAQVHFSFVSPADGKAHLGEIALSEASGASPADLPLPGKTGEISASTSDPEVYEYDKWPFGRT